MSTVTFSDIAPASPVAGQLVVPIATLRSIAHFADIEARLARGEISSVILLGPPSCGLLAWAKSVSNASRAFHEVGERRPQELPSTLAASAEEPGETSSVNEQREMWG
jgi:hypothetical protein